MAPAANDAVSHGKSLAIRLNFHRELGDDGAISSTNFVGQGAILRRIQLGQAGADRGNCATLGGERALMSSGVDPSGETAHHGQAGVGYLVCEFLGRFGAVMRGAARADNSDRMLIALLYFAPNIEDDWRRMDFAQRLRIRG